MKKQNLSNLDHLEYDYRNPVSEFSERATVVRQPRFSLKSTDNLSLFHDVQNTSGSGTITDNPDEFVLSTSGSGDEATLESAEFGRYTPGFSAQLGIGIRKVSLASGGIIEWGGGDENDNFLFRETGSGLSVIVTRNGSEQINVPREQWNVDKLDGSGPSGIDFDGRGGTLQGDVWHINYTWYGYGTIVFSIVTNGPDGRQREFALHRYRPAQQTSIRNPNLQIRASVKDGGKVAVGGRQFSNYGGVGISSLRPVSTVRTGYSVSADGFTGAIAMRRKSDEFARSLKLFIQRQQTVIDRDSVIRMWVGASVTGGSWTDPPDVISSDSAAEVNTDFTSFDTTNATAVSNSIVTTGGGNFTQSESTISSIELGLPIPRQEILLLGVETIGSQSATASSVLSWFEAH